MTLELLIHSIVRQTTILIARLATSGGTRAPLAQVADQVFVHLVRELEQQGVSRRVCADMFGLGLRTYQRKIQRLNESVTDRGRSLWEVVLDFIRDEPMVTRAQVLRRFSRDDESQVRSVLHDLCESRLVFSSGTGRDSVYRAASDEELKALQRIKNADGLDELVWALVYRLGPVTIADLALETGFEREEFEAAVLRLMQAGRVECLGEGEEARYASRTLVIPMGSTVGWEAAVFDHFKALVNTITARVSDGGGHDPGTTGGCTFTLEVWQGHPLAERVYGTLSRIRTELGQMRLDVEAHNQQHGVPEEHTRVLMYAGQCLISEGNADPSHD